MWFPGQHHLSIVTSQLLFAVMSWCSDMEHDTCCDEATTTLTITKLSRLFQVINFNGGIFNTYIQYSQNHYSIKTIPWVGKSWVIRPPSHWITSKSLSCCTLMMHLAEIHFRDLIIVLSKYSIMVSECIVTLFFQFSDVSQSIHKDDNPWCSLWAHSSQRWTSNVTLIFLCLHIHERTSLTDLDFQKYLHWNLINF